MGLDKKRCAADVTCGECYKYVHFNGPPPLFFDCRNDPDEFQDRSGDGDYQGLMLEYAARMLNWRMDHDEPALAN